MEKEVLNRMPGGTLEFLAMAGCDDEAMGDSWMEKAAHDASMIRITTMRRTAATKSMGWTGFDSSQL
jgi:hypothetical protein